MPPADHPIWAILKQSIPVVCATVAVGMCLAFRYNQFDERDPVTMLIVFIVTGGGGLVSGLLGSKAKQ